MARESGTEMCIRDRVHAGQVSVEQDESGGMAGDGGEGGLGREDDFDAGAGGEEQGFQGGQQSRVGGREQEGCVGIEGHGDKPHCWMYRRRLENI